MKSSFGLNIPVFQLTLDNPDQLAQSVARIKDGPFQYTSADIKNLDQWATASSLCFLADKCLQKTNRNAVKADLQNRDFYYLNCDHTAKITYMLLDKMYVETSLCDIGNVTNGCINHYGLVSFNFPNDADPSAKLYDATLRQFINTDKNGSFNWEIPKDKLNCIVGNSLLSTQAGQAVARQLVTHGTLDLNEDNINAYIDAFTDIVETLKPNLPAEKKFAQFVSGIVQITDQDNEKYASYARLPGDEGFESQFTRTSRLLQHLGC